jgi:nucleotide-binding universal stress UspA family protein
MSKKFMVAVDGSDNSFKALDVASELAKAMDASLTILYVVTQTRVPQGLEHFAQVEHVAGQEEWARYLTGIGEQIVRRGEARAKEAGVSQIESQIAEGNAAEQITIASTSAGIDMLFVGSRGLSDIKGLIVGSVSHKVMHLAQCTCVAVK